MTLELNDADAALVSDAIRMERVRLLDGLDSALFVEIAKNKPDFARYVENCRERAERLRHIADVIDQRAGRFDLERVRTDPATR